MGAKVFPQTKVNFENLQIGRCRHSSRAVFPKSESSEQLIFPSTVGLIRHPHQGVILYDTGYANRMFDICRYFPEKIYTMITPVELQPKEELLIQLRQRGISAQDVRTIIISHFHADHIGGLRDFPQAKFICSRKDLLKLKSYGRLRGLKNAFLRDLLPDDFYERVEFVEDMDRETELTGLEPFSLAYDIFADDSLLAIPLPGHTEGQLGLFLQHQDGEGRFLVADACWHTLSYQLNIPPAFFTRLIHHDFSEYKNTLGRLHKLHLSRKKVHIIPCHCSQTHRWVSP